MTYHDLLGGQCGDVEAWPTFYYAGSELVEVTVPLHSIERSILSVPNNLIHGLAANQRRLSDFKLSEPRVDLD